MNYREKMREYLNEPGVNGSAIGYGKWCALNPEQRKLIRRLLDELDAADAAYKELYLRNHNAIEMIKGTQFYGMRSGKTLLSKYFNELLVTLGDGEE